MLSNLNGPLSPPKSGIQLMFALFAFSFILLSGTCKKSNVSNPKNVSAPEETTTEEAVDSMVKVLSTKDKAILGLSSDLVILKHSRTGCYGKCPIYTITVWGDGRVFYEPKRFTAKEGNQQALIPKNELEALVEEIQTNQFFQLPEGFPSNDKFIIADFPTKTTTCDLGEGPQKVVNRGTFDHNDAGESSKHAQITQLEKYIEKLIERTEWHPAH